MRSVTTSETTVHRQRLSLTDAPAEVLRRFRDRPHVVALTGAWHHGDALIAADPIAVADDPFDLPVPRVSGGDGAAGFGGGWIGVWGHRLGRRLEDVGEPTRRPVAQPDAWLAFFAWVVRRVRGTWWLEWLGDTDVAPVLARLGEPAPAPQAFSATPFTLTPTPQDHQAAVARAVEHVHAGDLFQVNLCARLDATFSGDPLDAFCTGLERLAPAYGAFVRTPDGAVASFSPELFLRRGGHEVLTSPIKGTAPLTGDDDADPARAALLASAKDRAENVMIVDLMRNDLGRVCAPGSVRVPSLVRAERHAVWQLVSDVVGHLETGADDGDLLRATFPPGSVTGAPKVRAMQIAAELEPTVREAYTGAIGHVSPVAGLEANVVIRTLEFAGDWVWMGVGGGIVADSDPAAELAEVFVKAAPVLRALGAEFADPVPPEAEPAAPGPPPPAPPGPAADPARGVFTTLLVRDGRPVDLAAHVARLDASVRAVFGRTIRAGLESAILTRAAALGPGAHRVRVDAVPSGGDVRVGVHAAPLVPDPEAAPSPWRLAIREIAGGWGEHKWADRAGLEPPPDVDDVLVVDVDGSVLETGRAAVALVLDDGVHVPPLDGRILPGTARARLLDDLAARGVPVHQRRLSLADVRAASELFAVNALRGVVPVGDVAGVRSWPDAPGPLARALREPATVPVPARPVASDAPRVLFVDNYDSFVYNLVQYVRELGAEADVVRNDAVDVGQVRDAVARGELTHVVLSPGPGAPADAGRCIDLVRAVGPHVPMLGVCLGHQAIAEAYGARVVRAPEVVHGKPSLVHHDGRGLHAGLPDPLVVARYHSLVADEASLPADLHVTSRTAAGVVMGLRHREHPVEGVQWHPESILTRHGHDLLATFLAGTRSSS